MDLLRSARPRWVILRHEDRYTHGIPDISVDGNGKTSWWEAKHIHNGRFKKDGNQELMMQRLARETFARYIIWEEVPEDRRAVTKIVHPRGIDEWTTQWEGIAVGFNHQWVLETILQVHSQ